MADPVTVKTRLESLAAHYAVFEPDQVLTHHQLNSVADYLDDQVALTRVDGLGVGIVAGLHVGARDQTLLVGRGLGLTTDGDMLRLAADTVFDQFRPYDATAPRYAPFFSGSGGAMFDMVELVRKGESDVLAKPLADLAGWQDRVVVMLAECAENDPDLCTGADCDNLGRDALLRQRVLLMKPEDAKVMLSALPVLTSPAERAARLPRVAAARPSLGPDLANTTQWSKRLQDTAGQTVAALRKAIDLVPQVLPDAMDELFAGNPVTGWHKALDRHAAAAAASPAAALAWYHASKDLAETWNAMRDALFDDDSVPVPDFGAFRKHLLLGLPSAPRAWRTGLYPSPLVAGTRQHLAHAKFLLWKLHVLLDAFAVPRDTRVAITPSLGEAAPLEERAVPWYYAVKDALPIHVGWNYKRSSRDASGALARDENRGYRAGEAGWPTKAQPLAGQVAPHDFFRIEGHLGQPVEAVAKQIEALAATHNLAIGVRAVLLHNQRRFIKLRPPIRYSDLHRFHLVLRKDLESDLKRSQAFSGSFKGEVDRASAAKEIPDRVVADTENTAVAAEKHAAIQGAVGETLKAFAKPGYLAFRQETAWKPQFEQATMSAAGFKQSFGTVLRTDVSTAFDHLVNNPRRQWLDWLDVLIDRKDEKADERLLFASFVRQHPGVDPLGGTWRGGTLVLLYDDTGAVIGDLALPYRLPDDAEDDDEPDIQVAPPPPIIGGIKLIKPLDMLTANLQSTLKTQLLQEVNVQRELSQVYTDTIVKFGEVFSATKGGTTTFPGAAGNFTDKSLDAYARQATFQKQEVETLRQQAMDDKLSDTERRALQQQLKETEAALAKTVSDGTRYIVDNKVAVASGSDGARTLGVLTQGAGSISDTAARKTLGTNLTKLEADARAGSALDQANALANIRIVAGFGG